MPTSSANGNLSMSMFSPTKRLSSEASLSDQPSDSSALASEDLAAKMAALGGMRCC